MWLRLARKKAPSARRSCVARSKGVLGHRAFAPRPEHEFWMTHISCKGGDAAQSRWHQKDRRHQPETSDTKKHSISTSCDHMHSIHRPMHLSASDAARQQFFSSLSAKADSILFFARNLFTWSEGVRRAGRRTLGFGVSFSDSSESVAA